MAAAINLEVSCSILAFYNMLHVTINRLIFLEHLKRVFNFFKYKLFLNVSAVNCSKSSASIGP